MPTIVKHKPTRSKKIDNPVAEIRRLLNPSDGELSLMLNTGIRTIYRWLEDGPRLRIIILSGCRNLLLSPENP